MNRLLTALIACWVSACALKSVTLPGQKILFVVSNAHYYGESTIHTGNHFGEIVFAYDVFVKADYEVDFVSPRGGAIPLSYIWSDTLLTRYLYDEGFMNHLEQTQHPSQVDASAYAAIFYSGGGAALFDVPFDQGIQDLAMNIYEKQQGIISAVCHGTAGIVNLKKEDGSFLVAGKRVNGFPDLFEDKHAAYFKQFPFSIEEQITAHGGLFTFSSEGWDGYLEVDDRLITGQDPTSSAGVAKAVLKTLAEAL